MKWLLLVLMVLDFGERMHHGSTHLLIRKWQV
jgi:hypothetical protein